MRPIVYASERTVTKSENERSVNVFAFGVEKNFLHVQCARDQNTHLKRYEHRRGSLSLAIDSIYESLSLSFSLFFFSFALCLFISIISDKISVCFLIFFSVHFQTTDRSEYHRLGAQCTRFLMFSFHSVPVLCR